MAFSSNPIDYREPRSSRFTSGAVISSKSSSLMMRFDQLPSRSSGIRDLTPSPGSTTWSPNDGRLFFLMASLDGVAR